jgi:hypothetical protein
MLSDKDAWKDAFSKVIAHCKVMSDNARNCIGIGSTGLRADGTARSADEAISEFTGLEKSSRFILVAPDGYTGAVAGLIGRLNYYESPTFKQLSGIAGLSKTYTISEQEKLLDAGILPLDLYASRGIIIVKGICLDRSPVNVTRVSDHAVRGIKNIADLFIGTLNTQSGRTALKGKITEFLTGMEREGSIVPSVDGKDPAFKLDVYSSQDDFSNGIVRVDMAVRPVRAMDYIYATIVIEP